MPDPGSLSELCSICYAEKPKYRCPRCRTQTCSLPCYKTHQQRASCSGRRDPAAYLRRSQLNTPRGLDHDYNYLRSVERSIDHASHDARDRGIGVHAAASKNVARGWEPHSSFQQYLAAHRITLHRAPMGMSRQKANATRGTKNGGVLWTVEWATADAVAGVQHDCPASSTVAALYAGFLHKQRKDDVTADAPGQRGKKRKRVQPDAPPPPPLAQTDGQTPADRGPSAADDTGSPPGAGQGGVRPAAGDGDVQRDPRPEGETTSPDEMGRAEGLGHDPSGSDETGVPERTATSSPRRASAHRAPRFYLFKPATTSASRVLILISGDSTLTECLTGQIVQEYPSIYVLGDGDGGGGDSDGDELPPGFITEAQYEQMRPRQEDDAQSHGLVNSPAEREERRRASGDMAAAASSANVDAQRILDMLKRDVRM